ncbi:hypothetical protein TrCOL_g8442 [Triparma columacea]|uniref:Phytanoyl-CoA dioxygenase n=1 Tax=Triparma columacea TaxID=722753 RepID=A0A9W7LEJ8_9STRA|nr:hypothetical protein TrCOL_g8442 [Triparma columacea]
MASTHDFGSLSSKGKAMIEALPAPEATNSWIRPSNNAPSNPDSHQFHAHGFLKVNSFVTSEEADEMIAQMTKLVDESWHPGDPSTPSAVFRTDEKQESAQGSSDYFLDSADRVHFFAEKDALKADGTPSTSSKVLALNKSGHGLHVCDPLFQSYSTSSKIASLVRSLGWVDPRIPQSMYIFKQPRIGGEVTSHQDSTFLHTEEASSGEPAQSCLGLWLALHPATVENGCLWVRPGSHREPLRRRFVRNPKRFVEGDDKAPQMIFEDCPGGQASAAPWEGKLPEDSWPPPSEGLFAAGFVPVECEAGDLVVFPGTLDHLSLPNYSSKPRHTFQLHMVEGPGGGRKWSSSNWLQYGGGKEFVGVGMGE